MKLRGETKLDTRGKRTSGRISENIKGRRYLPQIEDIQIFSLSSWQQRQYAQTQFTDCPANVLKLLSFIKDLCYVQTHNLRFSQKLELWILFSQRNSFTKLKSFKAFAGQSGNWVSAFCRCFHIGKETIRISSMICGEYRFPLIFSLILWRLPDFEIWQRYSFFTRAEWWYLQW